MSQPDRASSAAAAADAVARHSYGTLLAALAAKTRDVAEAEDALAEAFRRALTTWPTRGVPDRPEAWLARVARNAFLDRRRSADARHRAPSPTDDALGSLLPMWAEPDETAAAARGTSAEGSEIPDRRVDLMFVCAHPAIAEGVRTPLMLQTVLGLDASAIATVYAMPAVTLAQRLVRAKRKIKDAGIPFGVPAELDDRLAPVLEAVYAAYALDWFNLDQEADERDLRGDALYLANLVRQRCPEPEALGLEALLSFLAARHEARFSASGAVIPVDAQDSSRWDPRLIAHGEAMLRRAAEGARPGRFQYEAAVQQVHLARRHSGAVDWAAIADLYRGVLHVAPTRGAAVAHAAAIGEAHGAAAGLAALDGIQPQRDLSGFQPYWAARAHLLRAAGEEEEARKALDRAIDLVTDRPLLHHLREKRRAWAESGDR
ncbi:MAG: DUF6596 domain-containing protein [Myxococcota bacterium]